MLAFQTAVNASSVRNDGLLSAFTEIPNSAEYGKHGSCYSSYTNPRNLAKFTRSGIDGVRQSSRYKSNSSKTSSIVTIIKVLHVVI